VPNIEYVGGRKCHAFKCLKNGCKHKVRRYLGTKDATSTSMMWRHAKTCWGEEAVKAAHKARAAPEERTRLRGIPRNGSITAAPEQEDKERVSHSRQKHTKSELRYAQVHRALDIVLTFPFEELKSSDGFRKACDPSR
jgi:hypothetical protein